MARKRYIKPAFFDDEDLAECSPHARLLFIGLWCQADRNGILEDRQRYLGAKIFPYGNDVETTILFAELIDHQKHFLLKFEVNGKNYLKIKNFTKHQHPHPHEKPEFPLPPTASNGMSLQKVASKPLTRTSTLTRTITRKDKPPCSDSEKTKSEPAPKFDQKSGFQTAWKAYPEKAGKGNAEKSYNRTVKNQQTHDLLIQSIANYLTYVEAKRAGPQPNLNHKNGQTFFNNWTDFIEVVEVEKPLASEEDEFAKFRRLQEEKQNDNA